MVLIAIAYSLPLQSDRLIGGPDWIRTNYDIEAHADKDAVPAGTPPASRDRALRLMLQSLLVKRFQLRLHSETKEGPVYEITVKNGGPKMAKSRRIESDCLDTPTSPAPGDPATCHTFAGGPMDGLRAQAASLADLTSWMLNWTDHPIVDRTGLQGLFDIETEAWLPLRGKSVPPPQEPATAADARPTIYQVFDRLGLKLKLRKGPSRHSSSITSQNLSRTNLFHFPVGGVVKS